MATKESKWIDAILKVLENTKSPIHYAMIWEIIRDRNYLKCDTKTPEISVNTYLQANKDTIVPFGNKGCYILKKHLDDNINKYMEKEVANKTVIRAYGIEWSKEKFLQNNCNLLGKEKNSKKAAIIDFSQERGIYVLYKGYNIVYVGQTINPLSERLKKHAQSNYEWDSFSWYGLDDVTEGSMHDKNKVLHMTAKSLLDAFEAVMISAINPLYNKKKGNHIGDKEYQQV